MFIRFLGVFVCGLFLQVNAQTVSPLQSFLQTVKTMQADFVQVVSDESGSVLSQTQGVFYLHRPNKFRWDYRDEFDTSLPGQQIIANESTLSFYDPDINQVTQQSLQKALEQVPSLVLLQNNASLNAQFTIRILSSEKDIDWLALEPKHETTNYQQLQLGFDDSRLQQIILFDALGNKTSLVFQNIKVNQPLDDAHFRFVPPKDADIFTQ